MKKRKFTPKPDPLYKMPYGCPRMRGDATLLDKKILKLQTRIDGDSGDDSIKVHFESLNELLWLKELRYYRYKHGRSETSPLSIRKILNGMWFYHTFKEPLRALRINFLFYKEKLTGK